MSMELSNTPRSYSLVTAALSVALSFSFPYASSRAMEGPPRTSDAELHLDRAFNFSQGGRRALPSSDCTLAADAEAVFDANRAEGSDIKVLQGIEAKRFVEAAYRGKIEFADYANLDFIAVEKLKGGSYRVYPGSFQIMDRAHPIYCGFERPQTLSAEWADAGLNYKTLYSTLPDPTPFEKNLDQLSLGFDDASYEVVRNSLKQRGFKPVGQSEAVVDRCSPGLEGICEAYSEAACEQSYAGKTCGFEWQAPGGEHIAVEAEVGYVSATRAQITVHRVEQLKQGAQ